MLRLFFVPARDIERLKTRLLTDLKLLPSMKNLIDKSELISKLQTLEGLTSDERSSLIGLLREHKKYGLVWEDKPEDVEERLRESLPVLREVKDKAILSREPDALTISLLRATTSKPSPPLATHMRDGLT